MVRQTRNAARVGTWGNAAVVDQTANSATGTSSGFSSIRRRKWSSEPAGPG